MEKLSSLFKDFAICNLAAYRNFYIQVIQFSITIKYNHKVNAMQAESIARKWGNSLGFIIPQEIAEKENIRANSKVRFEIIRVDDISDTFGTLKRKISSQKMKDLARKGWE